MEARSPIHVAFFAEYDLEKVKFTMKHLACRLSVEPVHVHVFLRTGRDAYGYILDRRMVAKLAEVRQYLLQTQATFQAIKAEGSLHFEEVRQNKPAEDCLADLLLELSEKEEAPKLVPLPDDVWDDPWTIPSL